MRIQPLFSVIAGHLTVLGMVCCLCLIPLRVWSQQSPPLSTESAPVKPPPVDPVQLIHEKLDFANGLFQREFYEMALSEYQEIIAEYPDVSGSAVTETPPAEVEPVPARETSAAVSEETAVSAEAAVESVGSVEGASASAVKEDVVSAGNADAPANAVEVYEKSMARMQEPADGETRSAKQGDGASAGSAAPEAVEQTQAASSGKIIAEASVRDAALLLARVVSSADQQGSVLQASPSAKEKTVWPGAVYIEGAYIGSAESLFFLGRYTQALLQYRKILAGFPQTSRRSIITVRMGQCLYRFQKYEWARRVFEKISADEMPEDLQLTYLFYYGESLKALGHYEKAAGAFRRLVRIPDSGDQAWFSFLELAETETLLKNNSEAEVWFDRAFEKAGSDAWKSRVLYRKGRAQFESGQYSGALKTFQMLLDKFPDQPMARRGRMSLIATLYELSEFLAITRFYETHQNIWDFTGDDYQILRIIIKSFELSNQPNDALFVVEKVLNDPRLKLDQRKVLARIRADLLLKTGQFDKLRELTETTSADVWPDDYRLFLKAEAFYGAGKYASALEGYQQLCTDFPDSEWRESAIYGQAFSYRNMGLVPESVQKFNELFNVTSDEQKKRDALYNIVLVYNDASLWTDALTASEKFLSVALEGPEAERVRYLRGYFYFKKADYAQAVDILQTFIDRYPESVLKDHALFYIGYSHQSEGRAQEAFRFYDRIPVEGAEDSELAAAVIKNRALLYLKDNQDDKAAEEFRRMMRLAQKADLDPDLILWLIEYDIARQNYDAALKALEMIRGQVSGEYLLRVNYLIGDIYRRNNDCEAALPVFDLALQSEMNTQFRGLAYLGKINCLGQLQKYREAVDLLKPVLDQYRDDAFITLRVKFEAARLEENQGNFEQAAKLYMFAAVLYKDEEIVPQALYRAGQVFEKLDKKIDAVKAYSEILRDYAASDYVQKAQERIKVLQ